MQPRHAETMCSNCMLHIRSCSTGEDFREGSLLGKHSPLCGAISVGVWRNTLDTDGAVKKTYEGRGCGQSGDVSSLKIIFRVCLGITVCVLQAMNL